jgi:hypothetical protein
VALAVGAGDQVRIAILDLRAHLGVRHRAAAVKILDETRKGEACIGLIVLVVV